MDPMARALELATHYRPHPNPRVGAVIVDPVTEMVIGAGAHSGPGSDHAEVVALAAATERVSGSTMYVTLEPCAHHGRTPPCADALIAAGVSRVVVGAVDPDVRVGGRGIERLRQAGVEVVVFDDTATAEAIDPGYFHHRRLGRSRFTLKMALTLDGNAAAADGTSQWITGEAARRDGHRLRSESDAVLVGAGTVIADDPRLNVRMVEGHQPRPVIVLGRRRIPDDAQIWDHNPLVVSTQPYDGPGEHVPVASASEGQVDVVRMAEALGDRGLFDVLVEGGPSLASSLLGAGLVDRAIIYYGAVLAGGLGRGAFGGTFETLNDAVAMDVKSVAMLDGDVRVELAPKGH